MTESKLAALIAAGYGQRHLHLYKPWLRVTKRECSPCSIVGHLPAAELRRLHHFRSRAERTVLQLIKWLGAIDARDQYPFWPWEHDHPLVGLPGMAPRSLQGLLDTAASMNIEHGVFVGTNIPYVATMDILGTWRCARNGFVVAAFDCKPKSLLDAEAPGSRMKQRLVLNRRYCKGAGIHHRLTHAELLPTDLTVNLDALYPLLGPDKFEAAITSDVFKRVVEACHRDGYSAPASRVVEETAARYSLCRAEATRALQLAIWTQALDHDISLPLELWNPLVRGGRALRKRLMAEWSPAHD